MPVFFWQQRLGVNGSRFLLYKFRTLRTPFGEDGRKLSDDERLSPIGRLMRRSRLDELPQLLNILVGDMSLVGPRPLLPRDQPENIEIRLMVRPGITGWAQVNGGVLLSPDEKERLDEWYIRNASLWLDLRIAVMTALMFVRGDRRTQQVEQTVWTSILQINEPQPRRVGAHRPLRAHEDADARQGTRRAGGRDPEFARRPQLREVRRRLTTRRQLIQSEGVG
jgi:hypothetical protein